MVFWALHKDLLLYKIASPLIAFRVDTGLFCSPGWPDTHSPLVSAFMCRGLHLAQKQCVLYMYLFK